MSGYCEECGNTLCICEDIESKSSGTYKVAAEMQVSEEDEARSTGQLEAERNALAGIVWRLTKGKQPKMDKSFPFNPDYTFVTKSDLAMVLTVYEAHTDEEARQASPWYLACKAALDWPRLKAEPGEAACNCDFAPVGVGCPVHPEESADG